MYKYQSYDGIFYDSLGYTFPTVYFAIWTMSVPCYFMTKTNTIPQIINSKPAIKKQASFNAVVLRT